MNRPAEYPTDIYDTARSIWGELLTVKHPASTADALRDVDSIAEALMTERTKAEFWKADAERQTHLLRKAVGALVMVRDADDDCRLDGLPTMPPAPRSKIDAALVEAGAA